MPEDVGEKTEPPTPRRRNEARAQGQVGRSQDLTAAVLMLAGFASMGVLGPVLWASLLKILKTSMAPEAGASVDDVLPLAGAIAIEAFSNVMPLLVILFLAMLITAFAQVGPMLTMKPMVPSLNKINPLTGLKRLFSIQAVVTAAINFGKLLLVCAVAYATMWGSAAAVVYSGTLAFRDVFALGSSLVYELGLKLAVALLILAIFDFAWQKYKTERDLKMTKEEVKDELRSMEGDPQIKRRRRQLQFQAAMQRLRHDVPTADVVVTNPTHLAIAIRYDADSMPAPKVVAKGADYLAIKIRQIASDEGIPIVERKPLARALYDAVDVGAYIPERFYRAIAEILAYVYELTGRQPGAPRTKVAAR